MTFRALALGGAAVLAISMVAPAADASVVTINNVTAAWSGAIPGATYSGNGTSDPQARWGTPASSGGQSGYGFDGATPPAINVTLPPSPSPNFTLGTFTHYNQPITGNSITSIVLTVTAQILIDSVSQGTRNFVFNFLHDETDNGANPCAFGGANGGSGVNQNGCADRVRVSTANSSESFMVDGVAYTLNIVGFTVGGSTVTDFLTKESANNPALLTANLTRREPIPEPASMAILGMGLFGLGYVARRRRAV